MGMLGELRARTDKIVKSALSNKIVNSAVASVKNQFAPIAEIGGGNNGFGFPFNQGTGWSNPAASADPLFTNLRWYLVSNDRQLLNQLYAECNLVRTICQVPVQDALRGGIEVISDELNPDQIRTLLTSLDRDDEISKCGMAEVWNRLFGGAGILILTDQDPETPLELENIGPDTPLEFRPCDMWELFWDKQNTEGYDPAINSEDFEYYNYYSEFIHKSRVMRLTGIAAPSFLRPRLRGWGMSEIEGLVSSINQFFKNRDVTYQIMDEFKIDVYKIKNLVSTLMGPNADNKIQERVQKANFLKNYMNALVMDSEDDWDHKQLNMAGMAEMIEQNRIQLAADTRIPMNKLFGQSATGFASGQDTLEIYNAMVESEVRNKLKYQILRVVEIKCQKLFGFVPSDLTISFKPLRELSAVDEQTVKTQEFARALQSLQVSAITMEQFIEICNTSKFFSISIDPLPSDKGGYLEDKISEGIHDPYDSKDIDNPGADRLDTRKSRATEVGSAPKDPKSPPAKDASAPEAKAKASTEPPVPLKRANSAGFDKASFEADGGDKTFDMGRKYFYENPQDAGLWESAKAETRQIYGRDHEPFTIWLYSKQGGLFTQL